MMVRNYCSECFHSWEYYRKKNESPPCPVCGYPELKTREQYYKSFGIETKEEK